MTSAIGETGAVAAESAPWWKQRWGTISGGYVLASLTGIACAEYFRHSGDWDHGLPWERALLVRLHTPLPHVLDSLMLVLPWFGTNISLIPAIAAIVLWLGLRCGARHDAVWLAVVQIGSYLLNPTLKALFERDRPDLFPRRGWYGWSSFPSGHAIASVSVLITLAIVLHRVKGWTWPFWVFVPIMLASLYSRLYLGVHWPTDVMAGAAVGFVWLGATSYAFRGTAPVRVESLSGLAGVDESGTATGTD
ncbi:MAG TPA: phosphatase PAP2 family protein [Gemmatimonadaceae bacterium]|nr:phosphatase PAP2 family protein [Gemmatimonadaceae bacterium]